MEKTNKDVKEKILSASRIKTLETCSWSYWCNYHLKLPQKQNEGALRGTVCHLVFEMLVKKKHKKLETLTKKITKNRLYDRTSDSWINLRDLKKLKLRLKDRINQLKH